jgi:hypothetical protein
MPPSVAFASGERGQFHFRNREFPRQLPSGPWGYLPLDLRLRQLKRPTQPQKWKLGHEFVE